MAWIMKNSATMQIDRRDQPYLTDELKKKLDEQVVPRYPNLRAVTLPALHAVQHEYGWIPYQAVEEIADYLNLSPADVLDTASFYEEFWLHPKGKYLIGLCRSISCELMGQKPLLEAIKQKLGIEEGQTTDDGRFTLLSLECLGSCDTAPVALVNEKLHERLTLENFSQVLDDLP